MSISQYQIWFHQRKWHFLPAAVVDKVFSYTFYKSNLIMKINFLFTNRFKEKFYLIREKEKKKKNSSLLSLYIQT